MKAGIKAAGPQGLSLAITLLLGMLLLVLVSVGSMYVFANLTFQDEFRKLPPEIQNYLRIRQQALQKGEEPPPPPLPPKDRQPREPNQEAKNQRPKRLWLQGTRRVNFYRNVQERLIQVGLLAVLVAALLAWLLSRRLSQPMLEMTQAASQLAQGDLSVRAPVGKADREINALANSFNQMAQSLEALEAERQQAVADIAHELRTPLAVMQARIDALEDGIYPMNTEQIALLSTQTQLLTRLVGDLRTLTLADAGQLGLQLANVDLTGLVSQVVDSWQSRAEKCQIKLSYQANAVSIQAQIDQDRVGQMLGNLIENALRHAKSQVLVSLKTTNEQEQQIILSVEDDGEGISEEQHEQVFMRFSRLDESRSRDTGGSGLGLPIVRALAGAHGGKVSLEKSSLGGAKIVIWFGVVSILNVQ